MARQLQVMFDQEKCKKALKDGHLLTLGGRVTKWNRTGKIPVKILEGY